jgi:hypothetical protein
MTVVKNRVSDVSGNPETVEVRIRPRFSAGWLDGRQETVIDGITVASVGGFWQAEVRPTSAYEDPGAYYEVREGRTLYAITVPDAGEWWLGQLLVTPPQPSEPLYAAVLVLDQEQPVPAGTPVGTVILRRSP